MDGKTKAQVKDLLHERWRRIERAALGDSTPEDDSMPQAEMIDMAQSLEQAGRDSSLHEQERREMLAIEHALSKLSNDGFGTCEDCGEEIPSRRLLALPEARLCTSCQAVEERHGSRIKAAGSGPG